MPKALSSPLHDEADSRSLGSPNLEKGDSENLDLLGPIEGGPSGDTSKAEGLVRGLAMGDRF